MNIVVNGTPREAAAGTSLLHLLESLRLNPDTVVVEHNGAVVGRATYATLPLADADQLEIVRFVGGG